MNVKKMSKLYISLDEMRYIMKKRFHHISKSEYLSEAEIEKARKFLIETDINEIHDLFMKEYDKIYSELFKKQNKGIGAGGNKTNINGKNWEYITSNVKNLLNYGYKPLNNYLVIEQNNVVIRFFTQGQLKQFILSTYGLTICRNPDEEYLIQRNNGQIILKILEKKYQNVDGSVEDKLLTGNQIKREYMMTLESLNVDVSYAYCLSGFLEKKIKSNKGKFIIWNKLFLQDEITILYGENDDYFVKLNEWINNF
jgi:hypothetical protein